MIKTVGYSALLSLCMMGSAPVAAEQTMTGCTSSEEVVVGNALNRAKQLTLKAATSIGDTDVYERWFGTYSLRNAEKVRATLKAVITAIRGGGVTVQCESSFDAGCNQREYAWVYPGEAYLLHICPQFFSLPPLTSLQPGSRLSDNGTREGTIIHELSHFTRVAGTEDHCYSRSECRQLARRDPLRVIDNADSYQYFTEDVTYYARQPVSGKPAAAAGDQ